MKRVSRHSLTQVWNEFIIMLVKVWIDQFDIPNEKVVCVKRKKIRRPNYAWEKEVAWKNILFVPSFPYSIPDLVWRSYLNWKLHMMCLAIGIQFNNNISKWRWSIFPLFSLFGQSIFTHYIYIFRSGVLNGLDRSMARQLYTYYIICIYKPC
jgi:hypothetical protein